MKTQPSVIATQSAQALRNLIAFATARSYSANTNNPLNSILPLFEPIAAALHGRPFDTGDLSKELRERYDLIVSEELCGYWANQLAQQKLLVPIPNAEGSGGFQWSQERISNAPDGAFAEELTTLLQAMRRFASESGDLITGALTDEQLVSLLRRGAIASMFPRLHQNNNPAHKSEDEYVFARFVAYAQSNYPSVVDSLATLRRAAIYSDLILHLREPRRPSNGTQIVYAYLDSPLVMDLVGLGGKLRKAFADRLVKVLREMKVVCVVSPVMIDEIRGNIRALIKRDPRDRFGPTADALRRGDFKIEFVEACYDRVEALIEDQSLQIDRNFNQYLKPQYDQSGKSLEEELLSKLQSHYKMFGAAERDAESLFGCFGRRDGHKPQNMYFSKCFFVTSNDMLAAVGNKFFREKQSYQESTFPIVITRATMAAMADAIGGVATKDSMTEQELIISAADATSYDPVVFDKIEVLLKDMTPSQAEDLSNILQRTDVSQLAMDLVRGSASNVNSQRVSEIVDSVKNKLELEAEARVAANIESERKNAKIAADDLSAAILERDSRILALNAATRRQHDLSVVSLIKTHGHATTILGHARIVVSAATLVVALAVGIAVYLLSSIAEQLEMWAKLGLSAIAALGAAVPLLGIPSVRGWFQRAVEHWQAARLHRQAESLGYELPRQSLLSVGDLETELNLQFAKRIPKLEEAPASDLFDKS